MQEGPDFDLRQKNDQLMETSMATTITDLRGKVAIVTGAGSGIGEAAALAFGRAGASVVLVGRRRDPLEAVSSVIDESGGEALAVAGDVSVSSDIENVIAKTLQRFGRIDCAFNNAGIQGKQESIVEMAEEEFDKVIAINLKGVWLAVKHEAQAMIRAGTGGAIVNTSSFLSTGATVGSAAYSASKAGLDAMVRAAALELGASGIRINNINPGVIDTPMLRAYPDEIRAPLADRAALHRLGTPDDIADVALWLCSEGARFITGQSILVDGGFNIPGPR